MNGMGEEILKKENKSIVSRRQSNETVNAGTMLIIQSSLTRARILMNCLCLVLTCYRYA